VVVFLQIAIERFNVAVLPWTSRVERAGIYDLVPVYFGTNHQTVDAIEQPIRAMARIADRSAGKVLPI